MALNDLKIMQEGSGGSFEEITKILPAHLSAAYQSIVAMAALNVDWSTGQVFTKTLSVNSTLTFSNLFVGVKDLEITGNYTLGLPTGFKIISGAYDGTVLNLIQVMCTNASTPTGWVTISQQA